MTAFERKRRAVGLTQTEVARRVKVAPATVSRWESGLFIPDPRYFPPLAKVLRMTPEELTHLFATRRRRWWTC